MFVVAFVALSLVTALGVWIERAVQRRPADG